MTNIITTNLKIMRAINDCDKNDYKNVIDELLTIPGILKRKYFIWNIIRGRDFYRMFSWYIANTLNDNNELSRDEYNKIEKLIRTIIDTTKRKSVKINFAMNLTKQISILTIDLIPYLTQDRLNHILTKSDNIIADKYLSPFIEVLYENRLEIKDLRAENALLTTIMPE